MNDVQEILNTIFASASGAIILVIAIAILILYLKWLFIKSAVREGMIEAYGIIQEHEDVKTPRKVINSTDSKQLRL